MQIASGGRIAFVTGDLDDADSLARAVDGAWGVFFNTNFWTVGTPSVARERRHGLAVMEAARKAGVRLFVHSSLDAAAKETGGAVPVPHYDAKAVVEHEIDWRRSDEFFAQETDGWFSNNTAVLVTEPYMENFQSIFLPEPGTLPDGREGLLFRGPLAGRAPWPMVALADIGAFARLMFADPETWAGRTLRIGSDAPTLPEMMKTFERVTGIPAAYAPPTDAEFLASDLPNAHDVMNNFDFYRGGHSVPRDYAALRKLHPGLRSWEMWLRETGWRGEAGDVQKDAISGEAA